MVAKGIFFVKKFSLKARRATFIGQMERSSRYDCGFDVAAWMREHG